MKILYEDKTWKVEHISELGHYKVTHNECGHGYVFGKAHERPACLTCHKFIPPTIKHFINLSKL